MANSQNTQMYDGRWTTNAVEIKTEFNWDEWRNVLRAVRAGSEGNFDRLEFEFSGSLVPFSRVGYAEPPFKLGETEETVEVIGSAFLEIALMPAFAHEIRSGVETVEEREDAAGLTAVKEIRRIYDHEGQVVYVLGLDELKRFRVLTLSDPSRLVVDINIY